MNYDEKELMQENGFTILGPGEIVTTIFCPDCDGEIFEINNIPTYNISVKDIIITVDDGNKKVIVRKYYSTDHFKGDIEDFKKLFKGKIRPRCNPTFSEHCFNF